MKYDYDQIKHFKERRDVLNLTFHQYEASGDIDLCQDGRR